MFRLRCVWLTLLLALTPLQLQAHGSVTADADLCIIRIGFYTAHFKVYQPAHSGHREFCEDLPARGETLFVMEYLHRMLGEVPLEFTILRNPTGLGRFTQLQDLPGDAQALQELTVLQHRVDAAPDVLTVRHVFAEAGDYVGLVRARNPGGDDSYLAVFPFAVESPWLGWMPMLLLVAVLLAQGGYWWSRRRQSSVLLLVALLPLTLFAASTPDTGGDAPGTWQSSRDGRYRVLFQPDLQPLPLNRMHAWTLLVQDAEGRPVSTARLQLDGGMPAHNHGLPSMPAVQALPEPGRYRIEGLRFHMPGDWALQLRITQDDREDLVLLPVRL